MSFAAPERLWLVLVPLLVAGIYLYTQRRRTRYAVRFTRIDLLDRVAPDRPGWRRHLPALLSVLALIALSVAVARPVMAVPVVNEQATVVLALDLSLSMEATDVVPSRIAAAREAAVEFIESVPRGVRVGLVGFGGTAWQVLPPTTDREALISAVRQLTLTEGTAIGEAVFTSLDVIGMAGDDIPAEVVLLSDGETTMGRADEEGAAAAVEMGVPINTVAFGTDRGVVEVQGQLIPVPVDQRALGTLAETTGGAFHDADTASELERVFDRLGRQAGVELEEREVADLWAGAGLGLLVLAVAGSLLWFNRLP